MSHPGRSASGCTEVGTPSAAAARRVRTALAEPRIGEGGGRMGRHVVATAAVLTLVASVLHAVAHRPGRIRGVALGSGLVWAAHTAEFATRRIRSGPPTPKEIAIMIITSVVIPPVAVYHRADAAWR